MIKPPRTIQIFLPTGDPSGIRIAEVTTSIIRVIDVPRRDLSTFLSMPESSQVGIYFLISEEDHPAVYIGQSGNVGTRVGQHHKEGKKEFERVVAVISLTNNFTQTHALYLESISIDFALAAKRYQLLNGNVGQKPYTPEPLKADCEEIHRIASMLLATLGYPVFESLTELVTSNTDQELFYCQRSGVDGKAYYTQEGMVVLAGSSAPMETTRRNSSYKRQIEIRDQLIEQGILAIEDNRFVFLQDYLFKSPSAASCILLLGTSNGWTEWKTANKTSLSDYVGRDLLTDFSIVDFIPYSS